MVILLTEVNSDKYGFRHVESEEAGRNPNGDPAKKQLRDTKQNPKEAKAGKTE